jgi:hypothetical protein
VAIGLLGAVAVAAALGERRRRFEAEAFRQSEASAGGEPIPPGDGLEGGWDDQVVDDETVATIDYQAADESVDPGDPNDEPG